MEKLPSKSGERISKKLAKDLFDNFKKKFKTKNNSTYYTLDVFQRLMSVPGCVGVRIYPGEEDGFFKPILIPVDENGDNIYDTNTGTIASEENAATSTIEERGGTCPPYCPPNDL